MSFSTFLVGHLCCRVPADIVEDVVDEKYASQKAKYLEEINGAGPISIGSWAVALAVNCLQQSYPFGPPEGLRDVETMGLYFKSLTLCYETRAFTADVYRWTGLAQQFQLINESLLKMSMEIHLTVK